MNIENFQENRQFMSHSGFSLTELEAGLIENSLIILQSQNKFRDISFLARIDTSTTHRYYIAFGYQRSIFKDRKYFYSLNAHQWMLLPDPKPKLFQLVSQMKTPLSGDPMNVESVCKNPIFIPDRDEVFKTCPRSQKDVKEEDRLACIVHMIMNESAIHPRGILYRQVTGHVTYNPCFKGLNHLQASEKINFQLFRYPLNNRNYNVTKREDYNYQTDFFDTIDDLIPTTCFSFAINDRDVCLIRSLLWPGMTFFHKINSPFQGFFYFGNGLKNLDILMMT
jgi:radial spoke head protein 9